MEKPQLRINRAALAASWSDLHRQEQRKLRNWGIALLIGTAVWTGFLWLALRAM